MMKQSSVKLHLPLEIMIIKKALSKKYKTSPQKISTCLKKQELVTLTC